MNTRTFTRKILAVLDRQGAGCEYSPENRRVFGWMNTRTTTGTLRGKLAEYSQNSQIECEAA